MGLDSVELIMAFEDEFCIQFDGIDAENSITPLHVVNYIYERVKKSKDEPCPSQIGFYKIRKILIENFNLKRNEVTPSLELESIIGHDIRKNWNVLQKLIGVEYFPPLKRNQFLVYGVVILIPLLAFMALLLNGIPFIPSLIVSLIAMIFFNVITQKMANRIPYNYRSVATLIPFAGCNDDTIWEKEKILQRVIEITSEQLGIPVEEIRPDSHFVEELGID